MKKILIVTFCIIFSVTASPAQTPQSIQPGFTVEREIAGAEKHNYEVNLAKGEMLNFVVEQRGVDLILRIYAPDGKFYDRVDNPNGRNGEEPFKMVSFTGGRYRIEINRYYEPDPPGKYFVKTVEIRKATNTEMKTARLKDELLKIVTEDTRANSFPDALKRLYLNTASYINSFGYVNSAAELIDSAAKNPYKPPADFSFEDELSEARMEDFGNTVTLNLRQSYRLKIPSEKIDLKVVQRIGYVFKRAGGQWRIISVQRTLMPREVNRNPIKLEAKQLDAFVGEYDSGRASELFAVTREGEMLYGQFPTGEKFPLAAETENTFSTGAFSVAFVRDASGAVTHAIVHNPFYDDRVVIQKKVK